MTSIPMTTEYVDVKVKIGAVEFTNEELQIDSIKISNGCYDGSVFGIGNVYIKNANITMNYRSGITKGLSMEIFFEYQGAWISFGKFVVTETPVMSGDKLSVSLESEFGQTVSTSVDFTSTLQEYTLRDIKTKIEEITGKPIIFVPELTTDEEKSFLEKTACFLKNISDYVNQSGIKTGISVRDMLSGIAILFGGNVYEDTNNKIIIKQKTYYKNSNRYVTSDYLDSNYKYSQDIYAVRLVTLTFLPWCLGLYNPPNASGRICTVNYLGEDKVSNTLLASQSSMDGRTPYDYTIDCDWVGWTSDGSTFDTNVTPGGRASACLRQGDLMYRTCDMTFVGIDFGWNIAPGNLIKVKVPELENPIDVLCGEISYEWDGGFTTNISCNCNIESNGSYSTQVSTQASAAAAQEGRQTSLELNYANITFSNIEDSTIRGSIFKDGTIDGSKIKDSTITGSLIADSTIKGSNIEEGTITGALIVDGTIRGNHIMDSAIDSSKISESAITGSKISDSTITGAKIKDGEIENSKIKDATLTGSKIENSTLTNDLFKDGTIENSKIKDGTIENSKIKDATLTGAKIQDATIGFEKVNTSFIEDLTADKAYIENLKSSIADIGYLTADDADIAYAKIDFSNVGTQVVSSSMIIDGAVTNEKVANLSANKITSGTIDASKITVSNLNASNINTGTLTVGGVTLNIKENKAEIDGSDIKDGTVTLEGLSTEVKDVIDVAIETFTKSEIPTLNNEPASLWTDNETRKKHIGDVCYVLNPTSDADGYCYRFANTGTEESPSYEWVLIKDSDVTKALQDIIDINGDITGIKKFDTEISSWKNDTDDELSSLKLRTATLETDMGSKVESSVFNEVKQTVDENSSSIASLSTTVSKKADGSTVETLTNTVNEVKQTANSNSLSISGMQTEISKKADGSTVTELSTRTSKLEQNLDGFKTEVSKTYTTKTDFDNLEIGGRNLFSNSGDLSKALYSHYNAGSYNMTFYDDANVPSKNAAKVTWSSDCGSGGVFFTGMNYNQSGIKTGDTVTFSVWLKCSEEKNIGAMDVEFLNATSKTLPNISTSWQKYIFTGIANKDVGSTIHGVAITFYYGTNMKAGDILYISSPKLELGNKATDWTQSPEDTEAEIQSVDNKLTTNLLKPTLGTVTKNGVTCTNNGDRTYTINGTNNTDSSIWFAITDFLTLEPNKKYKLVGAYPNSNRPFEDANALWFLELYKPTESLFYTRDFGDGRVFTATETTVAAEICVRKGATLNNFTFKPMLTTNLNATYDDFVPYTGDSGSLNGDLANNHKLTETAKTIAEQTADKFSWLVKSGTSSTNFTLTDRVASLLSEQFNIDALTTFKNSAENGTSTVINGGAIKAKTIKADSIDVDNLFAQDITATGTITGATLKGTDAEITNGKIGNFSLSDGNFKFSNQEANLTLGKSASFGYGNYGLSIHDYRYSSSDYCAIFTAQALRIGESSKKGGNISFTTLLSSGHITTPEIIVDSIKCNGVYLGYKVISSGDFTCLKYDNGRLVIEYRSKIGNATSLTNISSEGVYYQLGSGGTFPVEFVDTPMVITGIGVPNLSAPFVNVSFDGVSKTGYNRCIFWATYSGAIIPANSVNSAIFIGRWDKL